MNQWDDSLRSFRPGSCPSQYNISLILNVTIVICIRCSAERYTLSDLISTQHIWQPSVRYRSCSGLCSGPAVGESPLFRVSEHLLHYLVWGMEKMVVHRLARCAIKIVERYCRLTYLFVVFESLQTIQSFVVYCNFGCIQLFPVLWHHCRLFSLA